MTCTVPRGIVASPQEVGSCINVSSMSSDDVLQLASCVSTCFLRYLSHKHRNAQAFACGLTWEQLALALWEMPALTGVLRVRVGEVTPTGKPPPLAVRLEQALPFRR